MSGGSHNYLHAQVVEFQIHDLRSMAASLRGHGYEDMAALTEDVEAALAAVDAKIAAIASVWQAAEWLDSCDWGPDALLRAVDRYRKASQ